jgi:putative membrane protein
MKEAQELSVTGVVIAVILSSLAYFFLGIKYDAFFLEKTFICLVMLSLLIYYLRKGLTHFSLFGLVSITTFIGIGTAFNSSIVPHGPIIIALKLGLWSISFFTLVFSLGMMKLYDKMKNSDKYSIILFITFLVYWVLIAINAKYLDGWIAENALVVPFLVIIFFVHKWFRFSKLSYSLIFIFMVLHVMGSHYTYAEVPLGYGMSDFFNLSRNHFDRVVHFAFGLLWAYPMREMFRRIGEAKGFWGLWIPVELVLALSCVFELIEWAVAVLFGGDLGIAYLGSQGDIWDAQKDMALAGLGSIVAMLFTLFVILRYDSKKFFIEFKDSLRVKSKVVMGEVSLEKFFAKKIKR